MPGIVKLDTTQKTQCLLHSGMIHAFDRKFFRQTGTCAYENRIESFREKVIDGHVLTDCDSKMEFHAKSGNLRYFMTHDLLRQPILRNAVKKYASRFTLHLENLDIETLAGKIAGDRQTRRTAAYDCHLTLGLFRYHIMVKTCGTVKICYKSFQFADVYVFA